MKFQSLLYFDLQAVVGEVEAIGQPLVRLGMKPDFVGEVREKRAAHAQTAGEGDGIGDQLVGMVGLLPAQGIDHKRVNTLQIR